MKTGDVFGRCGFVATYSFTHHILYEGSLLIAKALLWRHAMERIVNLLPRDREISQVAQMAIAKHLLANLRNLNVETQTLPQSDGYRLQELWENALCFRLVHVASFSVRMCVRI